jgi:hypothetical protein
MWTGSQLATGWTIRGSKPSVDKINQILRDCHVVILHSTATLPQQKLTRVLKSYYHASFQDPKSVADSQILASAMLLSRWTCSDVEITRRQIWWPRRSISFRYLCPANSFNCETNVTDDGHYDLPWCDAVRFGTHRQINGLLSQHRTPTIPLPTSLSVFI